MRTAADLQREVGRYQGGLLLDTNVLLLHLVHSVDASYIATWKKTQQFTTVHSNILKVAVRSARRLVTTPHVLTEVTNHSDGVPHGIRDRYWFELRRFIELARERTVPSKEVSRDPDFVALGLADVAQALLSWRARPLIVTVDAALTSMLERRRHPCLNLNHLAFPVGDR